MYYTGVGSRNITFEERALIIEIGEYLAREGYTLRSGKANGADCAFALGAQNYAGKIVNYTPWRNFKNESFPFDYYDICLENLPKEIQDECSERASKIHPAWKKCGLRYGYDSDFDEISWTMREIPLSS